MEFIEVLKHFFDAYGAAALPYMFGALLVWLVLRDRSGSGQIVPVQYQGLIDNYHESIVANTNALTRLAVLLEERTRRQSRS